MPLNKENKPNQTTANIHFRANTLGNGMNPPILSYMGHVLSLLFLKDGFDIY